MKTKEGYSDIYPWRYTGFPKKRRLIAKKILSLCLHSLSLSGSGIFFNFKKLASFLLCYVRATSREEYIFQSGTHAVKSYWLWSQAMAGCSQGGIPWGFPPPAPPHRPQPFFAPVSCSNSVFICIWPPWKRHIPPEKYIPHEMLCGHSADIYLRGYMSALNPSSVFGSGPKLAR